MYTMTSIWLSCILQHQMLLLVRIRTTVLHSSSIIYVLLACRLLKVKFCRDARRHQKRQHLHKWTKVEATYTHFSVIYFESPQEDESQAAFLTNPFSHRSHKNKEILISTSTESTWGGRRRWILGFRWTKCYWLILTFCWPCISVFNQLDAQNVWWHQRLRIQFWPPDDEHMCSKHVEAWNKNLFKTHFVYQVG